MVIWICEPSYTTNHVFYIPRKVTNETSNHLRAIYLEPIIFHHNA